MDVVQQQQVQLYEPYQQKGMLQKCDIGLSKRGQYDILIIFSSFLCASIKALTAACKASGCGAGGNSAAYMLRPQMAISSKIYFLIVNGINFLQ